MPTRRLALPAVLIVGALTLSGCGAPLVIRASPGLSPAAALWAAQGSGTEGAAELVAFADETAESSRDLLREVEEEVLGSLGAPDYLPNGGGFGVAPVRMIVPGLDEPVVVTRTSGDQTRETPTGTLTETGRVEHTVSDQVASLVLDTTTSLTKDGTRIAQDSRQSNVSAPVCAADDDGSVTADWTLERRVETVDNDGTTTRLEASASATVTSGAKPRDSVSIDDFELRVTRTTTTADGERTVDHGTLGGRFESWGSDVIPTETEFATLRDVRGDADSEWFSEQLGNLLLGTLGASTVEYVGVLRTALEARQSSGLCVTLEFDTGGVTTVANGESATIDAWVIDTRTGERVDATITAETFEGSVSPSQAPSPAAFVFTASGDRPVKTVYLETRGPLGGDSTPVRFTTGWSFEGVELSITVDDYTGYQQWSGYVCGDPFTEPWHFMQVVDGFVVEYDLVVPPVGTRVNGEYGQHPMIERVPNPGDAEPPFRLYIDDVEPPEVSPQTQRVEVDVREGAAACEG